MQNNSATRSEYSIEIRVQNIWFCYLKFSNCNIVKLAFPLKVGREQTDEPGLSRPIPGDDEVSDNGEECNNWPGCQPDSWASWSFKHYFAFKYF